ncbi:hypothetical protein GCM10008955_29560 [Deinococcus malanensis]|uniref:Uncharacterized protein n=1 Tax=Deinococcus malanensis TaxID=1706855 RepID=A0ABQ2F039_9DEIO|nr:hypothetical protein [Deinococcus malanensis]GGK33600.1 hypothetical protein GCM10008955_29560 [Deinococcus malanensis]
MQNRATRLEKDLGIVMHLSEFTGRELPSGFQVAGAQGLDLRCEDVVTCIGHHKLDLG